MTALVASFVIGFALYTAGRSISDSYIAGWAACAAAVFIVLALP